MDGSVLFEAVFSSNNVIIGNEDSPEVPSGPTGDIYYENILNKPQINGVPLVGNKSSKDLKLPSGEMTVSEMQKIWGQVFK